MASETEEKKGGGVQKWRGDQKELFFLLLLEGTQGILAARHVSKWNSANPGQEKKRTCIVRKGVIAFGIKSSTT